VRFFKLMAYFMQQLLVICVFHFESIFHTQVITFKSSHFRTSY
jgi:hypothetical protein